MRLRHPGTIDAAITMVQSLSRYLENARHGNPAHGPGDQFLTWCEDQARPQLESLFAPGEELLDELEVSYSRINNAVSNSPVSGIRRLNAMLSREYRDWSERLGQVLVDLDRQKQLMMWPGRPVVLDTSVLMEAEPFATLDWHGVHPVLSGIPIRLVVPILVIEELDDLLHDRNAERRQKARAATRALRELHKTKPTEPAVLTEQPPGQQPVTIEVLMDGDWHQRRPNNDAEIIDQALMLQDLIGRPVLLTTCDLHMMYRAGAENQTSVVMPRAGGQ